MTDTTAHDTITENRKTGRAGSCVWCRHRVEEDEDPAGVGPGRFDWGNDGDYVCDASPLTTDEGAGGHIVMAELRSQIVQRDALIEASRAVVEWADDDGWCAIYASIVHDNIGPCAALRAALAQIDGDA